MAAVAFREVSKVFDDGTTAVESFSLQVENGEFVVLVGPSGSGKTTVLRMTAGLERPTDGEVEIGGDVVNELDPQERNIAMVFQSYALYPHMTVYDNMGFALRLHGLKKAEIRARVEPAAEMLGLTPLLRRKPSQLSGGQRQRVAMGRAIVREPDAFLMDEPLSNLDAKLRVEMRAYISMLHRRVRATTLYVTHDQTEAMTMGDRVAVMRDGRLEQAAEPQELYERPRNVFVAGFIGSPAMNLLPSRLTASNGDVFASVGGVMLRLPPAVLGHRPVLRNRIGETVTLGVRPEDVEDAAFASAADGSTLDVHVALAEPMGSEIVAHVTLDGHEPEQPFVLGEGGDAGVLTARLSSRSRARTGDRIRVAIDTSRLHFFDPETELALL